MEKLNYSDINKFLASLGVVIIGVGLVLPYFYLKEDFGLIIKADELANYSEITKSIISTKESYINFINSWILLLSGIISVVGLIFFGIGIKGWISRQGRLDVKLEIDIEKANREVLSMSPLTQQETEEKAKDEVVDENVEADGINIGDTGKREITYPERVNKYLSIESTIINKFKSYQLTNYLVFPQQRIDNRINVDILLQANKASLADAIVEIKYLSSINSMNARRILDNLNSTITYYRTKSGKFTIPILITVVKNDTNDEEIKKFKDYIVKYKYGLPNIESILIEVITEDQIQNIDIGNILGEVYDKSQLDLIYKKMGHIAGELFTDKR